MTERRREDRRVRRSRKLIVQAFERLLGERPYAQITVSAIAREADIDRKTFYQHFGSIDGLLAALADMLAEQVLDQVAAELGEAGAAPDGERALHVFFRALTEHFEQGAARDRSYAERIPFDVLYGHLTRAFERQIVRRGLLDEAVGPGERDASLAFILGGLFSLFRSRGAPRLGGGGRCDRLHAHRARPRRHGGARPAALLRPAAGVRRRGRGRFHRRNSSP